MSWPSFWSRTNWKTTLLKPLGSLVCWEAKRRLERFRQFPPPKPTGAVVIVVGNVVVGGSGKTPFIIWLVRQLRQQGLNVGIVSRGYGGKSKHWPQEAHPASDPKQLGDEPVLLAKQLQCPVAVAPQRCQAVALMMQRHDIDVIVSDDGLQHYELPRDIEVVMVDAQRQFGNGLCLPAGPLREPKERLQQVDFIVYNGNMPKSIEFPQKSFAMQLQPVCFRQLTNPKNTLPANAFAGQSVNAIAGIGNPQRFFDTLNELQIEVEGRAFADHYAYKSADFTEYGDEKPLLMTEKDAVKCSEFAQSGQKNNWWYLEVEPQADEALFEPLYEQVRSLLHQEIK
ncbi:tetraacyldisaccharide 4'-kinase [Thiomicrorhabdus sp. ZW0627]|uniref:tetraacyldisaccharide 4'-kinase n=1 Tax=Thiomicrorhabdus sp. ZW0627 TaxID=3039774 RepID=UPI0024371965|nr:tetraacyldisaccharide 4'-kinase [Thiomicrorhabdus sp. ZW0627]MDG6773159.1 tetraacyldisaccharide 4'-kinase [Thiomicrorhabdus sp. ZW0627]